MVKGYRDKDLFVLKSYFLEKKSNWYQNTKSIELYSRLSCQANDPFLTKILRSSVHENRLSVFEGCFSQHDRSHLIERGLKASYSFARYTTLMYMKKGSLSEYYQKELKIMIQKDSSSMVKNLAKNLLQTAKIINNTK